MDEEKIVPDLDVSCVEANETQKVLSDTPMEPVDVSDEVSEEDTDSNNQSDTDSDSDWDSEYECTVCQRKMSGYIAFKQHQKGKKHAKAVLKNKKKRMILEKDSNSEKDGEEYLIEEPYAVCKVCDKQFNGPESYEKHLKSKMHKRKSQEASILEKVKEEGKVNSCKLKELIESKRMHSDVSEVTREQIATLRMENDDEACLKEYECKECEKEFSGLKPYTEHLLSKSHMKRVQKNKLLHKVIPEESKDDKIKEETKERDLSTLSVEDGILVCKLCPMSFTGPENALLHLKSKKHLKNLDKYIKKLEKRKKKKSEVPLDEKVEEEAMKRKTEQQHKNFNKPLIRRYQITLRSPNLLHLGKQTMSLSAMKNIKS